MANDDVETARGAAARGSSAYAGPYVVGIGASAGGLAALRTLFGAMPRTPGFACVIVVHLAPHHESHLVELLQPYTQMRVQQVRDTTRLEANNVYVIPPNANLEAIDTHLRLSPLEPRRLQRAPIDHFLRTLAHAQDGRALGVILTGSGSDGSLGLRQIKEFGGLTIVQDPAEAEYDSMPRSAIQTAAVDRVLRLRDIPAAIVSFCAAEPRLSIEDVVDPHENIAVEEVVALLHARTGHDFKHFRRSVMLRKISRRMQLRRVGTVEAYLDALRSLDDEAHALCKDLLFTVTDFFDDQALFSRIEREVLPALFARKNVAGSRVRAWTIGCSTGEEAYSVAMLLAEHNDGRQDPPALQVFASDLSPETLAQAREGLYPREVAATVSRQRLDRFFTEQGNCYRITHQLRGLVVFAAHNVLRDPPYAHVDLIICRSLLSELRPEVRSAVLAMFHYALEPEGWLIVGAQDEIGEPLLFEYEDRRTGVLKRLPGASRSMPLAAYWQAARASTASNDVTGNLAQLPPVELASVHYRMMERYTPPSLLLSGDDTVAYYSPSAGRYVCMPGGEPTRDVFQLLCAPLPIALRGLLERSRREAVTCTSEPFTVKTESGSRRVVVRVEPPGRDSAGLTLVVIDELRDPVTESDTAPAEIVSALQAEIDRIEHHLRDVLEEHAEAGKQRAATTDDLQSSNQELRFILEQLESSKEETQVANEELTTLNIENRQRVDELGKLSSVLRHLLQSTGIATLFLDNDLRIVRFTSQLGEIFNVRDLDVGRPVAEITNRLEYEELVEDARRTLDHVTSVEREVYSKTGRWYLTRMLPYRAPTQRIEGVVVTFIDITDRKTAEQELRDADRRKDEFLALLAHELRNPLAPIVSGIDLLRQAKNNPLVLDQVTATMSRQVTQLVRLVDDLLELSRVSGGRLRLRKTRVPLRDVVRDAVASVRPLIERQRHVLDVKSPEESIELEADSARLTQVFANLLNNAARYTPEGGRITIEAAREGQEAVVTVSDNGIGIPASAMARIFEMFYQGEEGRPNRGGGLGIGLTLARSLIEMHGGTITAASAGNDRGSQFKVRLPAAEQPAAGEGEEKRATDKPLGGHRVLIVDDNTDAARTLGMLVETLGHNEVHVANNGSDALRIAEERRPDIVLLDLKMPGMDGYEVARRLRSESWGRDLTLVAVTGWTLEDHKRRSRDAGFDRHLTKPADVAALAALLSSPGIGSRPSA